eukprot:TRINITY_DN22029_c0_g1_i1.p1 TRINITY_DN22029_c0_g1~~TRINITY_DN22029_c0_g1_i1.p1  ORF type:complete len:345 (-),score=60.75 TRINITY_DN22029_c0_g1_i1:178-1212(-)
MPLSPLNRVLYVAIGSCFGWGVGLRWALKACFQESAGSQQPSATVDASRAPAAALQGSQSSSADKPGRESSVSSSRPAALPAVGRIGSSSVQKLASSDAANHEVVRQGTKRPNPVCEKQLIIDVGLPRTGTSAVDAFGKSLGYASQHIEYKKHDEIKACHSGRGCVSLLGREPSGMYEDSPWFGLGCQLARNYPDAVFILTTRSFDSYFNSIRYMLCRWVRCEQPETSFYYWHIQNQRVLYGHPFDKYCNLTNSKSGRTAFCGADRLGKDPSAWETSGLKDMFRQVQEKHDSEIRECIKEASLLEVPLTMPNEDKAKRIHAFLGCSGEVPEFKTVNQKLESRQR